MNALLGTSWWMLALRGVIAIAFGVLAAIVPGITLLWLVALFAVYAICSGAVALVAAVRHRGPDRSWWLVLVLGAVSVAAGVIAIASPGLTALTLVLLIGVNALVTGVLEMVMAFRMRNTARGRWTLGLAGLSSVVFGALVVAFPDAGALTIVWFVSFYAILIGILQLTAALRARASMHATAAGGPAGAGSHASSSERRSAQT